MKQALLILMVTLGCFAVLRAVKGFATSWQVGFGAISIMGAVIALTFAWLWVARATPLALGMAFSWAGSASVMGWWWTFRVLGQPDWMVDNPLILVFLSFYITGATLHFAVIQRSLGYHSVIFMAPVGLALAASAVILAAF